METMGATIEPEVLPLALSYSRNVCRDGYAGDSSLQYFFGKKTTELFTQPLYYPFRFVKTNIKYSHLVALRLHYITHKPI